MLGICRNRGLNTGRNGQNTFRTTDPAIYMWLKIVLATGIGQITRQEVIPIWRPFKETMCQYVFMVTYI